MRIFDPAFGRIDPRKESPLDFIFEAIDKVKVPLSRTDARIYLGDIYNRRFGIFNHEVDGASRPLSSVAFHDAQKYSDVSYFRSGIRRYFTQKVFERTGMSPLDFMGLPVNFSRMLLEEIETVNKQDSAAAANAEEEMRRQLQDAQQGQGKTKR